MAGSVAKIYGNALLSACGSEETLRRTLSEAKELLPYFGAESEFETYLSDPAVTKAEKEDTVLRIFKGRIGDALTGLFSVVLEKNRESDIPEILGYFVDAAKEKLGIGTAFVSLPFKATDKQKAAIEKKLRETAPYRQLEVVYEQDPELIGGMVVRIGDRIVDGSVKNRLNMLERELNRIVLD